MKPLSDWFTEHPASVGETYFQHLVSASRFSARMIGAGLCCLVHGFLPFLCMRTGSNAVTELHDRMVTNRARRDARPATGATAAGSADLLNAR